MSWLCPASPRAHVPPAGTQSTLVQSGSEAAGTGAPPTPPLGMLLLLLGQAGSSPHPLKRRFTTTSCSVPRDAAALSRTFPQDLG